MPRSEITFSELAVSVCIYCNKRCMTYQYRNICDKCRCNINVIYYANKYLLHWSIIMSLDICDDVKYIIRQLFARVVDL